MYSCDRVRENGCRSSIASGVFVFYAVDKLNYSIFVKLIFLKKANHNWQTYFGNL